MAKNLRNKRFYLIFLVLFFLAGLFFQCGDSADNDISSDHTVVSVDSSEYQLNIVFKEGFDANKDSIRTWIGQVYEATIKTLGPYRFDVRVNIIPATSDNQPVPFGLASRKEGINQVKLYVNESATFDELMADWTAPHELSHLSLPFVGKKNKWFSEGFATYCSRRIMIEMGYFTEESFETLYTDRFNEFSPLFNSSTSSFAQVSDSLLEHNRYSPIYWGGASFFMILDSRLQKSNKGRLTELIQKYQDNGRLEDRSLKDVIASFDRIIGENWCRELLAVYLNNSGSEVIKLFNER